MENENYDVIVIGSGMGGLAFASLAAQLANKRVLVLERHFKLGGYTHTFERNGYRWDVGLHYVGNLHPGAQVRNLFDKITDGNLQWKQMPEHFDQFDYPDFSFPVPSNQKRFQSQLIQLFPEEESSIRRHFADVKNANSWLKSKVSEPMLSGILKPLMRLGSGRNEKLALQSTKEYLDRNFKSERLKALVTSQWLDYGVPPSRSAFVMHAIVVQHYFDGAFYPVGGSKAIADSIVPVIKDHGGLCLTDHKVTEIIVENGTAKGVRVLQNKGRSAEEKTYYAPVVVSDAGIAITYNDLLSNSPFHRPLAPELSEETMSAVTLYLGLKRSPASLGFDGRNHWIFQGYDHDFDPHNSTALMEGRPNICFLSFPSMKSGSTNELSKKHTAEVIAPINFKAFAKWSDSNWKHRGDDYEEMKKHISKILIDTVENKYPGFAELIDFAELSTPLTNRDFLGHKFGALYGIPSTVENFREKSWDPHTPVRNLYLTGSDVVTLGIVGAAFGGLVTASHLYGGLSKFFEIVSGDKIKREIRSKARRRDPVARAGV
jgi:phytoene dehydrogenase-like protein